MSFPQILEVAIGLILIYYILGAMVSLVTQMVMESLETRGVALERYLKIMAGDMAIDLTSLPQIKALRPIRYARWWNVLGAGTAAFRKALDYATPSCDHRHTPHGLALAGGVDFG